MGSQFSTVHELPRHDEAYERRSRMRTLHARRRRPSGLGRHVDEGLNLGLYLIRLTVHAIGLALLFAGMFAILYTLG